MKFVTKTIFALSALLVCSSTFAQQYVDVGDYVIHYSAISTDLLTPQVAREYQITRSKNRGMLNISVLKKSDTGLNQPIEAAVETRATNLNGQRRDVDMRLINETDAKYYIGVVKVTNEETLQFVVQVTPEGSEQPYELMFKQKFFTQ